MKFLSGEKYKNIVSFKNKFDDIEPIKDRKKLPNYFKVFIIMDTDDCNENQKNPLKISLCLKNIGYTIILFLFIMTTT